SPAGSIVCESGSPIVSVVSAAFVTTFHTLAGAPGTTEVNTVSFFFGLPTSSRITGVVVSVCDDAVMKRSLSFGPAKTISSKPPVMSDDVNGPYCLVLPLLLFVIAIIGLPSSSCVVHTSPVSGLILRPSRWPGMVMFCLTLGGVVVMSYSTRLLSAGVPVGQFVVPISEGPKVHAPLP